MASELEQVEINGMPVAALDRVLLNCYGGTGPMAEQANIAGAALRGGYVSA